jgi:hypothetical protein
MKTKLLKVFYFLHISDGKGQLDITDLAFMAIIVKLLFAPNFDWASVCSMIPIIASQMHQNHIDSKSRIPDLHN